MNYKIKIKHYKFIIKMITIFSVFLIFNFCFIPKTFASILTLSTTNSLNTFHQKQQFFVDISLMPEHDENINAFDLTLSYSPNITFVGSNDGSSITSLWIEKPNANYQKVHLSGIIPGGFKGIIDPLDPNPLQNRKPGTLTRLIFSGNKEGTASISFDIQKVLANDGLGTILSTSSNELALNIDNKNNPSVIDLNDATPPEDFTVSLSKDSLLFDGKYALIFQTKDKESGIDHYEVKEDGNRWKVADSPYLLTNQHPSGTIYVKAVDKAGNITTEQLIPNIPSPKNIQVSPFSKMLAAVFVLILLVILFSIIKLIKFFL